METVYKDFSAKGVRFFYLYKSLAHPEWNGYVTPYNLEERRMHVMEAKRTLGSQIPWLMDGMDNSVKQALGRMANAEFVIDPQGKVVRKRAWSDPDQLRKDLEELVGPVENPTQVADLDLKKADPPKAAASGVVKRLERPGRMRPLKIEATASENDQPFYAKLRVEADRDLLDKGTGQLYIRFQLDPLYHVHWNNLTPPLQVRLKTPEGITLSQRELKGPEIEEEADIDPREFLIEIERADGVEGPIELDVRYFACSDEPAWCKQLIQSYKIHLERDRNGGSVFRGGMARRMRNRGPRR